MELYDDLFNMRRQFYEESRRKWEGRIESSVKEKKIRCPWCGEETLLKKEGRCEKCGFYTIVFW